MLRSTTSRLHVLKLTTSRTCRSLQVKYFSNQVDQATTTPQVAGLPPIQDIPVEILSTKEEVDTGLQKMLKAQEKFADYTQEQVDHIFENVSKVIRGNCFELGKYAVDESGIGLAEDKVLKNLYAAEYCYTKNKNLKTCGIIEQDYIDGVYKVAEPVGPICAIVPCTNPTSTVIMKTLCALKTRNTIMFLPHPRTKLCSAYAANLLQKYAIEAGAPKDSIMVAMPSREMSEHVMKHPDTRFILATGGPSMVSACYAAGKPAIGVGPGNCPVLIDESYNLREAINGIVIGKTFDWGTICASENSVIVMESQYEEAKKILAERGVYLVNEQEKEQLSKIFMPDGHMINPDIVGKSPHHIAGMAGITLPPKTVAICMDESEIGDHAVFSHEKLSPMFALYQAKDFEDGVEIARRLAEHGGLGHTSAIYSKNKDHIDLYKDRLPTYHVVVNMPTSLGVIGIKYNVGVDPTLTVGVGSKGGSIASANVGPQQLIQVKVVNEKRHIPEVFSTPEIYSSKYCLRSALENIQAQVKGKKALVVANGVQNIKPVLDELQNLNLYAEIFSAFNSNRVTPTCIEKGVNAINDLNPDVIIAVGDKITLEIAKMMRLKYENPNVSLDDLAAPFLESRWRNVTMQTGKSKYLVAIPTLLSAGSEMTPFSQFYDKGKNFSVVLDALQPDVVVQDPQFITSIPDSRLTRISFYSLLRGIESFVSVNSTSRTRLLAKEAIKSLYTSIPDLTTSDLTMNEKTSKSIGDIGISTANTSLGLATAMALAFSAKFNVREQISLALFITHVIAYNADSIPTRMTPTPNVPYPLSSQRYSELAQHMGLQGNDEDSYVSSLLDALDNMKKELGLPLGVKSLGNITEEEYMSSVTQLAIDSFGNQLAAGNPRLPLVGEIEELFRAAYNQ